MSKIFLGWDDYHPYEFEIPKIPQDKDIIGFDIKKKTDQYWVRIPLPDFKLMSTRETMLFIEKETERCINGVFFMNNGEPTYLTGMHYEHLKYNRFPKFTTPTGHPDYYDSQREDFYFRNLLMYDQRPLGGIWVKGRRYGLTAEEITNQLYVATHEFNRSCSMLSLNEKKAYKTLFDPLMYVLRNRPEFMQPEYYAPTGTEPQSKLEFLTKRIGENKEQLGSIISPVPTTTHVLDGETVHYCSADEVFKWLKCDPYIFHDVTKETLTVGLSKRGIINYTSTVGDDEKVNDVAITAGSKLWIESDATKVDEFGRTASGLWKWFIPSWKAMEGFVDKHGFAMKDKCIDFIMKSKRGIHEEGSPEWLGAVRRYPITEDEVWNTVQVAQVFDTIRLNQQLQTIRSSNIEEDFGIIKGNLERDIHSNKVYFVPTNSGRWEFAGLPNKKSTNRFILTKDGYEMPDDREYAVGCDPIRYTNTTSRHLSKTSIVGIQKQKFDWDNGTDIVIPDFRIKCIYNNRLETKEETYEDAINTALFLSAKICPESQVSNFTEDFLIPKGYRSMITPSPYKQNQLGVWTTETSTNDGIGYIQTIFLRRPRRNSEIVEQQLDYLVMCGFEKLIEQLKSFDPKNTTKSDIVMALIMAFFEYLQMSTVRRPAINKALNDAMSILFSKHN